MKPETETETAVVLLTAALGFIFSLLMYSFFSQPLRKFPGPFITTFSRIPYWIAIFTGNEHKFIQKLHKKYGPVLRYGPGELSHTDPRAWKDIYGYEKGRTENPKDIRIYGESWNGVNNIVTTDATTHARLVLAPAFSDNALYSQEELFKKYANLMVTKLHEAASSDSARPFDTVSLLNFTTFDIMAELTFGEPLGLLDNSEYTPWVQRIFDSVWVRSVLSFVAVGLRAGFVFEALASLPPTQLNPSRPRSTQSGKKKYFLASKKEISAYNKNSDTLALNL